MELFGEGFGGMAVLAEVSLGTSEVWLCQLLLPHHACLPAAMIPAMMAMDSHSETMRPHKYFFLQVPLVTVFCRNNRKVTKTTTGLNEKGFKNISYVNSN